jgi:sensor histidine kinase YesM
VRHWQPTRNPRQRTRGSILGYWVLQLAGWFFVFYAQASGEVIFASVSWSRSSTLWGGVCVAGFALTHALRALIRRRGWLALPPAALGIRIVAATLVVAMLTYGLALALSHAVFGNTVAPITQAFYQRLTHSGQLRNEAVFFVIVYAAWTAAYLAITLQRQRYRAEVRQAQLGEALRAAELRLLKSQLNPHFLFNALNGVRSLIADEPNRARDAVTHLARTLRYTLASSDEDLVTLERELEMVDDYLALESLRLAERLRVEREIEPAARAVRVPSMLLQTLVENAIKHGIAELKEGGTLRIAARVDGRDLVLRVDNPRPVETTSSGEPGVGLRNASERLRLLFGDRAALRLDLATPGHATAEARLPA